MSNAYNPRQGNEATFDVARVMQKPQGGLADFAALHGIGRLACCKGVHGCVEGRTVVPDLTWERTDGRQVGWCYRDGRDIAGE